MPRNVFIRPANLRCKGCGSAEANQPRYEVVIGPPPPEAERIYLCQACKDDLVEKARDATDD